MPVTTQQLTDLIERLREAKDECNGSAGLLTNGAPGNTEAILLLQGSVVGINYCISQIKELIEDATENTTQEK